MNSISLHVWYWTTVFVVSVGLFLVTPFDAYAASDGITVKLDPYVLGMLGSMPITASLLSTWVAMVLLITCAIVLRCRLAVIPGRLQTGVELMIGGVYNYVRDTLGDTARAQKYFPVIMTIFLFILTMNWVGLLPGVTAIGLYEGTGSDRYLVPFLAPPATDLNITIALAIVAFVTIEIAGVLALGIWRYTRKFINFSSPLAFVIGIIELISELARLIAFSFRLFGNIFAGKVLLVVVMALATPYLLPVPLLAYEVFVGFIQAFIFAILTLYFIKLATEEPH